MVFIGDVHGKWNQLDPLLEEYRGDEIIQVGDLGIGFPEGDLRGPDPVDFGYNFKFIRGNHDNPEACKNHCNYLGDFGVTDEGIGFISGAWSIDRIRRIHGVDWWPEEELSIIQMNAFLDLYEREKPEVMVSHDCPFFLYGDILKTYYKEPNRTATILESAFRIHQPRLWVFGHHHKRRNITIEHTQFVCLNELDTLDTEWL